VRCPHPSWAQSVRKGMEQLTIDLRYARRQDQWTRRRIALVLTSLAAVLAISAIGYLVARDLRARAARLDKDSRIGPVDWWAVARSTTLIKTAWQLSSPAGQPTPLPEPLASLGLRRVSRLPRIDAVLWKEAGDQHMVSNVTIESPRAEQDGRRTVAIHIKNPFDRPLIVPGFHTGVVGPIPNGDRPYTCVEIRANKACLGTGVFAIQPSEQSTVKLVFPAGELTGNVYTNGPRYALPATVSPAVHTRLADKEAVSHSDEQDLPEGTHCPGGVLP
jgi:hypothetical protein